MHLALGNNNSVAKPSKRTRESKGKEGKRANGKPAVRISVKMRLNRWIDRLRGYCAYTFKPLLNNRRNTQLLCGCIALNKYMQWLLTVDK